MVSACYCHAFKTRTPTQGELAGPYYTADDTDGHNTYYFNACGPVSYAGLSCEDSAVDDPIAIATFDDPLPPHFSDDKCYALGSAATQTCHNYDVALGRRTNLTCDYTGGDGGRSVSMRYICAPTFEHPTATIPDRANNPLHSVITFAGPSMCDNSSYHDPSPPALLSPAPSPIHDEPPPPPTSSPAPPLPPVPKSFVEQKWEEIKKTSRRTAPI